VELNMSAKELVMFEGMLETVETEAAAGDGREVFGVTEVT
jgi:hypothetical protein